MKKNIKYLGLTAIASILFVTNTNAYTISVEKNGHQTKFGYNTQTQSISGGSCNGVEIYCIEKGASNPANFYNCEAIDVSTTAYAKVAGKYADHDTKEYMYRVLANSFGDAATYKNGKKINNFDSLQNYSGWLPSNGLSDMANDLRNMISTNLSTKLNGSQESFSYKINSNDGKNATVTMTINLAIAGLEDKFSVNNGARISSINYSNGVYTIVASTPITSCKGGDFDLKVNASTTVGVGTNRTYLIKCNSPYQNYIVNTNQTCTIGELLNKNASNSTKYSVSVPDPNCDCKGTTTMTGRCDTSGSITDLENTENLKTCIKEGGFVEYCQTDLQKTVDNGSNAVSPVLSENQNKKTDTSKLAGNNYCKVYCLENIEYDLPGTIDTDNGSYFKLRKGWNKETNAGSQMKIKGTRTCYTSEIKKQDFINKVIELQNDIRDSWNEYQKNKTIKNIVDNKEEYEKTANITCNYSCSTDTGKKDKNGNPIMKNGTCAKVNEYTYYEATDVEYKKENGKANGDGTWSSKEQTANISVTWGNNPQCNADGSITEDEEKPTYTLNKEYESKLTDLANEIEKYKSCTEWTNNYCFDPVINFSYDEPYNDKVSGEVEKEGEVKNLGVSTTYYKNVNNSYTGGETSTGVKKELNYIYVGDETSGTQTSKIDIDTIYMKSEVIKEATFKDAPKEIYTYHPYGTIITSEEKSTASKQNNLVYLGYVLPVALQHDPDTGVYNYYLSISNIGVGGNDTSCEYKNKIIGDSCSIFNTKNEVEAGKEYICQYMTKKCPECEVECVCPDGSTNCYVENKVCKYIECPTCEVKCIGCLWNNGDTTISYKNISLDDVYEDDTTIGSNWTQEDVEKIEDKGQEIYDEEPMYSFTLTPQVMGQIREYNKKSNEGNTSNIPKGGYNNDTLTCSIDKTTNTAVNCKSSFLREILPKSAIKIKLPDKW